MTWLVLAGLLKLWLPLLTGIGVIVRTYFTVKKSVSEWASQMLDNHMSHIQASAEQAAASIRELAVYHKEMMTQYERLREDFHDHTQEDLRVQTAILQGIEVIKAKL